MTDIFKSHCRISCSALILFFTVIVTGVGVKAQYKEFRLSPNGDTLNAIDQKGLKQGKWVNTVGEIRGEPGYDEEGVYKNGEKTGIWRKYNATGDIIAMEKYKHGGKDGIQEYFSFTGDIERHEEWHGYDPTAPFDTIPVYGQGNNEIIDYKIVKATQYSVPHGEWKYYGPGGIVIRTDRYNRGALMKPEPVASPDSDTSAVAGYTPSKAASPEKPKEKVKTQEMLDYEKKYSKKKRAHMERDGRTGL